MTESYLQIRHKVERLKPEGILIFPLSFLKLIGIILILIGTIAIYPRVGKIKDIAPTLIEQSPQPN